MKLPLSALLLAWIWWSVDSLTYQDEMRKEREHCKGGLELQYDMPAYCDKYKSAPDRDGL